MKHISSAGIVKALSVIARAASLFCVIALACLSLSAQPEARKAKDGKASAKGKSFDPAVVQRNDDYARRLEEHLERWLVNRYPERAGKSWQRDYHDVDAFVRSVEPYRQRWREVLHPPALKKTGGLERSLHEPLADLNAEWLRLPLGDLAAEAVLALPPGATAGTRVPLVIAQHGIGSVPESPFGPADANYHGYGRELLKAGFAVLAPLNLYSVARRNRVERLARLAGTTLPGIEMARLQNLLDVVLADPRIDREKVGMWGVSLGGMATMFIMPLEPRIRVGVVSAWFNHRLTKMVVSDDRYSCFLDTAEEHAFFNGWLTEFADHDAITMICPRPVMIHHGKKDRIAHWPDLVTEFETARSHYVKLGIGDRIELDLHEGGHEARVESGIRFLTQWLKRSP